jgi:thiamine biosynthesis lipoprotein
VLDPSTGLPPSDTWRTVSVSAWTCARANALSTASIARPAEALVLLRSAGVPARLVSGDGAVITLGRWPQEVAP